MRVAFNALCLQEPGTGAGRYAYHLLRSLGRVDGVTEYAIFSPKPPKDVPDTPSTFTWETVPVTVPVGRVGRGGEQVERAFWEQRTFPAAARRAEAALMHVPYFAPPFQALHIPTVVTIHDVIPLRLPLYRSPASQAYGRVVMRAARNAAAVITVSDYSKADIMETLAIPEDRVHVIREAPTGQPRVVQDPLRLREVRLRYGLGERFVLNVGGLDARKNLRGLLGAFAAAFHELHDPELMLFVAGDPERLGSSPLYPDWRPLAATFGVAGNVVCVPVAEEDIPALHGAASCFAYASVYEGFGLAPLEAMACGAAVVCSDRAALPEVVGSAGILVNPDDPNQFGAALHRVLTSQVLRDDLRARGLARSKQFSWDQVAVETSTLYAEVTGTKRD